MAKIIEDQIFQLSNDELMELSAAGYLSMDDPNYKTAWRGHQICDFNLVLEGGGFRVQFTAGVLDFFMDEGIFPNTVIGVSAGALSGANYCAGMRGRTNFLNTNYCDYWRYYSMKSLLLNGDAFDVDFTFGKMLYEINPFDFEALSNSPIKLITVSSNLENGKADYHQLHDLRVGMDYLRASASVPLVSRVIHVDDKLLLDGGVTDSVPIEYSLRLGVKKQVVVLTQAADYIKGPNKLMWLSRLLYRKHPKFIEALKRRHLIYNRVYSELVQMHECGKIFLMRPKEPVTISSMEKDKRKLYALYLRGYEQAKQDLLALVDYLEGQDMGRKSIRTNQTCQTAPEKTAQTKQIDQSSPETRKRPQQKATQNERGHLTK